MIALGMIVFGVAAGVDLRRLAVVAAAIYAPFLVLVGLIPVFMVSFRRGDPAPALFCEGVASELRSGAAIREAIAVSAVAVGSSELARTVRHESMPAAAANAAAVFPRIARELEMTITRAASVGSAAADLFDEIGMLALAQEEIRREVRVAAAPARAATALFVILPAGFVLSRVISGNASSLVTTSGQRIMGSVGLGLFILGCAVAALLLWRAR